MLHHSAFRDHSTMYVGGVDCIIILLYVSGWIGWEKGKWEAN